MTKSIKYASNNFKGKINNAIALYLNTSRASYENQSTCGKRDLENNRSYAGAIYSQIKKRRTKR